MEEPLVSICCFAYNHELYIRECLDGFLMQQTSFLFEIIIHDDASRDKTADIIKEYEYRHPNIIKPIYQKINQHSIETGRVTEITLGACKGRYIAMCEGDDYWTDPLKLQKQVDALEKHSNIDICVHPSVILEGEELKAKYYFRGNKEKILSPEEVIDLYVSAGTQSVVMRNKNIEEFIKIIQPPALGGHSAMLIFYGLPNGMLYLPDPMAVYRRNSSSSVSKTLFKKDEDYINRMLGHMVPLQRMNKYFGYKFSKNFNQTIRKKIYSIISEKKVDFLTFIRLTFKYNLFIQPKTYLIYIKNNYL